MFLLVAGMALDEAQGQRSLDWFGNALRFIQSWMALFYAPLLVALPLNAASLTGTKPLLLNSSHPMPGACRCFDAGQRVLNFCCCGI